MGASEPSLKAKTAKGLFWGGINSGLQQVIALAFGIIFARMLSQDDYGIIAILAIFTGIAELFINSGFSTALINKLDASHKDYNAVFWFSLFVGFFLYAVLFFAAPLIAAFYEKPELILLTRMISLSLVFNGLGLVSYTIMLKELQTKQQTVIDTITQILGGTIGIIMIYKGYTYMALAFQSLVFLSSAATIRFITVKWRPTFDFDLTPLKKMFPFSIKLLITGIFTVINNNIFSVILGKFYSINDVGNYSQGFKWSMMGNSFINRMIAYVSQPVLAQVVEERERQINILRKLIRFGAFISLPLMIGFAFVGNEFIIITVGEKWLPSVPFLQIFSIWVSLMFLFIIYTNLIYTHGKSGLYMKITIITGLFQLLVIVCMYPFGIFTMVIAYVASNFVCLFVWHQSVNKLTGLRLIDVLKDITPYLGIALISFAVIWFITLRIQNVYLLFSSKIILSALLYILLLKLCNSTMYKESKSFILNKIK
jgi:O-antigen/teichoic acid export membrane protein